MTRNRSFKRLVRARMSKTGESYTAARNALLAPTQERAPGEAPILATSDAEIRRRTSRGWEEWFDLLDDWGADQLSHREIAHRVATELGIGPLVWEAQAVTLSYERARDLRAVGQRPDGFAISVSRTVSVPVEQLFAAFADPARRGRWLPDGLLVERKSTQPTSIHFDWGDAQTRVHAYLQTKGSARSTATVEHARLADTSEAERMKAYWRERLTTLKAELEAGRSDA